MTIREIDELIEQGDSLKTIAQAYSEIANLKIKRIRAQLERNRLFFEEMSEILSLLRKMAENKKQTLPKPKKRVCLVITSNFRFYGNINSQLIDFFLAQTKSLDTDRIILGKAAIDYFKAARTFSNYQEVLLRGDQPEASELTSLVSMIKDYREVLVFYSKLKTVLEQQPTVSDITKSPPQTTQKLQFRFIFEPDLPKILAFFDSQIITLLLEETFLESEVSRTASRFISMDQAETEANKFINEYEKLKAYTQRNLTSNELLESIAAIQSVRKEVI